MGMSSHVVGFRPPDARWREMKEVYDACTKANVPIPPQVNAFFNREEPDPSGVEVDIDQAVSKYSDDSSNGFHVDLTKLPADVKVIRFYNSW